MFLQKSGKGYYFLAEKVNGKVKYIKSLGKDPSGYEEAIKEGKRLGTMLLETPILVETLGTAAKRLISAERNLRLKLLKLPPIPEGDVYYADPPWQYDFSETITREVENQYPTMELKEIIGLPLPHMPDSALFLWVTAPKLVEAMTVIKEWGYSYKTHMIWDKEKIGMGYWFRGQHELLLVGIKGNMPPPIASKRISSVYQQARTDHSVKPPEIHDKIESMLPNLRYVELFARQPYNERWQVWGNEVV